MVSGLIYCVKCGSSMKGSDPFCSSCGHKNHSNQANSELSMKTQKVFFAGLYSITSIFIIISFLGPTIINSVFSPRIIRTISLSPSLLLPNIIYIFSAIASIIALYILFRKVNITNLQNSIKNFYIKGIACIGLGYLTGYILSELLSHYFTSIYYNGYYSYYIEYPIIPMSDLAGIVLNLLYFEIYFSFFVFVVLVFMNRNKLFSNKDIQQHSKNNLFLGGIELFIGMIYSYSFINLRFRSVPFSFIRNSYFNYVFYFQLSLFIIPCVIAIIPIVKFKLRFKRSKWWVQIGSNFVLVFVGYNLGLVVYILLSNQPSTTYTLNLITQIILFSFIYGLNSSFILTFTIFILLLVLQFDFMKIQDVLTSKGTISSKILKITNRTSNDEPVRPIDNSLHKIELILQENSE